MRRILLAIAEYLLGFLALAIFAYLAFASDPTSDERFVYAFKIASVVAVVELAVLLTRDSAANRLVIGANIWLAVGGAAAFLEVWWVLRVYQRFGEASLFASMFAVGLVSMAVSPAGFIGKAGKRSVVLQRSVILLLAVGAALTTAVYYRGNVKYAAVFPVIALSWLYRLLRQAVPSDA
jgi:hypothetical protein